MKPERTVLSHMLKACLVALALLWSSHAALAQEVVEVEVVDISGQHAYVQPGAAAGIHRDDTVTVGGRKYVVLASTESSALIERNGGKLKLGVKGTASTSPSAHTEVKPLPPPRTLAMFTGQWPRAELPSATQHPRPVPLGGPVRDSRADVMLALRSTAIVPTSGGVGPITETELRARVHYEPLREYPFAVDADLAGQLWLADKLDQRSGKKSRPVPRVRQLQAAYGEDGALYAALGRMRYAARTLGMLDGVRAQAPLGQGFTLGAFGGFVPNAFDERPDVDASRFGAEVGYRGFESALRPEVSLTAQGSRFAGKLDERRLTTFVDVYPGDSRVGGYAEVSLFDRSNPWNASSTELSAAGLDGSLRIDAFEFGARFDMQRPERSLWLASFVPPEWLCTHVPQAVPAAEACRDNDYHYLAAADAGVRTRGFTLRSGVTRSSTANVDADQLGAFLQGAVLDVIARVRIEAGLTGSTGALLHSAGANLGVGTPLAGDTVDLALRYRPALSRYEADTGTFLEHTISAAVALLPSANFSLDLDADFITGRDVDVLLVQTQLTLRPEF